MNLVCRTGTVAFVLALAAMMVLPAAARAAETSSVVNHGWKIVWGDGSARMIHVETGMEVELYLDEKGETEEDGYVNFEMLSVVGPVLSYSVNWYGEGGAHPTYGTRYQTLDLSKVNPAGDKDGRIHLPAANLAELFGEKAVFKRLMQDPFVQLALAGELDGIKLPIPSPTNLKQLLERADGECAATMGDSLLTDYYLAYRLNGNIAVAQIGLSHGCEVQRGAFTELHKLYFPVPDKLKADFDKAVRDGILEDRPFQKASFNCAKAGTSIEFAICTDAALAKLDVAMANRYKAARQAATGDARARIKQDQRDWIKTRNRECALPGDRVYYEKPGEFANAVEACLMKSYEARLGMLNR